MRKILLTLSLIISLGINRAEALTLQDANIIILLGGGILGLAGGLLKLVGQVHDWCDSRYRDGKLCCCCTSKPAERDLEADVPLPIQNASPSATRNDSGTGPDERYIPPSRNSAGGSAEGSDDQDFL